MSKKHPGKAKILRIAVPDEVCGPAMLALSPPMRAFAYEWVFGGTKSQKDAAIAAGYSDTGGTAKFQGSELMPLRGTAQVWRAEVCVNSHQNSCWVLRRFGSALKDKIELVSRDYLMAELEISRDAGWTATVRMIRHEAVC